MNKYNRQHGGNNLSGFMFWLVFAGVAVYGIWKVVEFKRKVNETHKMETEKMPVERSPYLLPVDSVTK